MCLSQVFMEPQLKTQFRPFELTVCDCNPLYYNTGCKEHILHAIKYNPSSHLKQYTPKFSGFLEELNCCQFLGLLLQTKRNQEPLECVPQSKPFLGRVWDIFDVWNPPTIKISWCIVMISMTSIGRNSTICGVESYVTLVHNITICVEFCYVSALL